VEPRPPGRQPGYRHTPALKSGSRTRPRDQPAPAINPDERSGLAFAGGPIDQARADQTYSDQAARRRRLPAKWLAAALITAAVALLAPGTSFAKPELRQRLQGVSR
jgi:hypothetical protein